MSRLLAAVGAVMAALLELTIVPYVAVDGAHPHLVLVATVVASVAFGLESGLAVAVAGGLTLDILAPRPLGATVFVLLLVAGIAAVAGPGFRAARIVAPIVLVAVASPVFSLGLMAVLTIAEGRPWADDPLGLVAPGAIYDTILAAFVGPLLVSIRVRALEAERFEW